MKSFSAPYTPEHNAIAEMINRTMVDDARSLLIQAKLPNYLWPFALNHVIYVLNRLQHSSTGTSPLIRLTNELPDFKNVRVLGCATFVLRVPRASKFDAGSVERFYL